MSTVAERDLMDSTVDKIIPLACNGNKLAEKYLHDMAWVNRIIDDLYDKDYDVPREDIEKAFFVLAIEIPTNPFYLANFQSLMAQHVIIYNTWIDSNKWENDVDETKRMYAHVLKDYIGELLPFVAFLTGGTGLMRKISLQLRESYIKEL